MANFEIDWENDDNPIEYPSGTSATHPYSPAYTGDVGITYSRQDKITRLDITGAFDGDAGLLTAQMPYLKHIYVGARNTISGSGSEITKNAAGITYFYIGGFNTISGSGSEITKNAPGITIFLVMGSNTISGSGSEITKNAPGITYFYIGGSNIISGSGPEITKNAPGITIFLLAGYNTIFGLASEITANAPGINYLSITGNNTISVPTPPTFNNTMKLVRLHGAAKTQTEVDNMLAGGAGVTSWITEKTFNVAGNNAAPSAAGIANADIIAAKGAMVYTN